MENMEGSRENEDTGGRLVRLEESINSYDAKLDRLPEGKNAENIGVMFVLLQEAVRNAVDQAAADINSLQRKTFDYNVISGLEERWKIIKNQIDKLLEKK